MRSKRLLWQLYPALLLIILLALAATTWYGSKTMKEFHLHQRAAELEARARLAAGEVLLLLQTGDHTALQTYCRKIDTLTATRVTVTAPDGRILADSREEPTRMENHGDRPEIVAALAGRTLPTVRISATLRRPMIYVAIPLTREENTIGILRTAMPISAIDDALAQIRHRVLVVAALTACLAALVSWWMTRRISRPLEEMRRGARRFAAGNFHRKMPTGGPGEIAELARAMNQMARELDERLVTVMQQRKELEAVFAGMVEGVLVFDQELRLTNINRAGARLMDIDRKYACGKDMLEVIRNRELLDLARQTIQAVSPIKGTLTLRTTREKRYFQVHGVRLQDGRHHTVGGLLVMHDISQMQRLEHVRRDFVANVSHELKTPITAIQGFVETLQDGALHNPDEAEKFLDIIARRTERLNAIVSDLLTLSRIEQQADEHSIELKEEKIQPVLQAALQICAPKAAQRQVTVQLTCSDDLVAWINPPLLEQAVTNLLDNAIKYGGSQTTVTLAAESRPIGIAIQVGDNGPGIGPQHQDRVFERFYRVDPSRGGQEEGTGLGLAIVKYIAQAHNGEVSVESSPGKGSTFTILLPHRQTA